MLDEAAVGGGEAQRHAAAGVAIDALVGEVQTRAVTLEQRPQRVPRKRLANVRPAPDFQNRRHGPSCYAAEIEARHAFAAARRAPRPFGPFRGPIFTTHDRVTPRFIRGATSAGGFGAISGPHLHDARP